MKHKSVSASESQDQVKGAFLLNIVVAHSPVIFKAFPSEDESLLIRGDPFFR